ncbi:MAG: hypothetical protein ACLP59_15940 [Bryobacteraceae bacterium]
MNRKRFILLGVPVCRGILAQPASGWCATLPPLIRGEVAQPGAAHRQNEQPEGTGDDEDAAPPPLRRSSTGICGLPADAPSARGLPDVRHRAGSDQAHTDAAARFVLFELLPVLRD